MTYTLTEVDKIPPRGGRNRVSAALYNDVIKVFIENQYTIAEVEVEGKNPDTVARRLESRTDTSGISVFQRGDKVYLLNHALVSHDE